MKIDEQNFRSIYDSYFDSLCKFLNYYTRNVQLIEEVVQDVFVKIWEEKEQLDIQYLRTYLFNAARNKILNEIRNERNRNILLESWAQREFENQSAEDCIDMDEFIQLLQLSVDSLPESCREIFKLSREENLTYREIATGRGISVKTVEAQMGIALKRIREKMSDHYKKQIDTSLRMIILMFFI